MNGLDPTGGPEQREDACSDSGENNTSIKEVKRTKRIKMKEGKFYVRNIISLCGGPRLLSVLINLCGKLLNCDPQCLYKEYKITY